ncbi:MAG: PAS domain S-box protein [Burkholderiales bacterium]|nr:PAS domain S-box protein [Burkholderiales bacterium]
MTAPAPDLVSPPTPEDALIAGVLRVTGWVLVLAGLALAAALGASGGAPPLQVWLNLAVSVIGVITLVLLHRGWEHRASQFATWCMWAIITVQVAKNGGLDAPNLLNYPVLIVVCGWLLGNAPTETLYALTAAALLYFYVDNPVSVSQPVVEGGGRIKLAFVLMVLGLTATLTLLIRRSHLGQLTRAQNSTRAQQAQEAELRKLSLAVEQSPENVVITNLEPRIEYVNDAFVINSGYSREEAIGQNPRFLTSGQMEPAVFEQLWSYLGQGLPWRGEFLNRRKNGEVIVESAVVAPIRQADGRISHYVATTKNLTAMRQARDEIQRLTHFDPLTGLTNRTLLMDRIALVKASARRGHDCRALIVINVDRCKDVNDARGQERFVIDSELRLGIRAGELRLFLQPRVDADGHWAGAEVLVRWQHPRRGLVPPASFIAIAEESDLIVELGVWVMTEACRLMAQEQRAGARADALGQRQCTTLSAGHVHTLAAGSAGNDRRRSVPPDAGVHRKPGHRRH